MKELLLNAFITELMKDASSKNEPSEKTTESFNKWRDDLLKKRQQYEEIKTIYKTNHLDPRLERELAVEEFIQKGNDLKNKIRLKTKTKKNHLRIWLEHIGSITTEFDKPASMIYTIYPDTQDIFYN
jgi:phage pi2 protein 07